MYREEQPVWFWVICLFLLGVGIVVCAFAETFHLSIGTGR